MILLERLGPDGLFASTRELVPKLFSKFLKSFKSIKLDQASSFVVSIGVYSLFFSWQLAVLIVTMLFVHEMGHLFAAAKIYKMKVRGIYFFPFFGAVAITEEQFPSRKAELMVALMGPLWGFLYALACLLLWQVTQNQFFGAATILVAIINLFNLLPVYPLDGGRVFRSIAVSWYSLGGLIVLGIGFVVAVIVAWQFGSILIVMLFILGISEIWIEFKKAKSVSREHESNRKQFEECQKEIELIKNHFCSDEGTVFFDHEGKSYKLDEFKIINSYRTHNSRPVAITSAPPTIFDLLGPMPKELIFHIPAQRIFKKISLNKINFKNLESNSHLRKTDLNEVETKYRKIIELILTDVKLVLLKYEIAKKHYRDSLMYMNPMTRGECLVGGIAYILIGLVLFLTFYISVIMLGTSEFWEYF